MYNVWRKFAANFARVPYIAFEEVDMTPYYIDGSWEYWTPLTRYYKRSLSFDYYYGDFKRKEEERFF